MGFLFPFFVNTTPGCGLLKNWILFPNFGENAWKFDFVLNLLSCVFYISGETFERNTFNSEKFLFLLVVGLSLGS